MPAALVLKCRVVSVRSDGVVIVEREDGHGLVVDVLPFRSAANPEQGAGDLPMPDEGDVCYVTFPSDGSRPFISAFAMPLEPGGAGHSAPYSTAGDHYGGMFPQPYPGDRLISGRARNYICLRKSGIVELASTPLASIMLFPIENMLRSIFGNLEFISPLGTLKWRSGKTGAAAMVWAINDKEGGQGGRATVTIKAGEVSDGAHASGSSVLSGGNGIKLEFLVGPSGKVFGYHVDAEGQVSTESDANVYLRIKRAWEGHIGERALLKVGVGGIDVDCAGWVTLRGPRGLTMSVNTDAVMEAERIALRSQRIELGSGRLVPAVRADKLLPVLVKLCQTTGNDDLLKDLEDIQSDCVFLK